MDFYMVPNDVIKGDEHSMFFITYAEVELLEAEAAVRGWHSGDRATHYANDVRTAMQYLAMFGDTAAITDADIDACLAANPYDAGSAMDEINARLRAAVLLNEHEAYANYRWTGYAAITPIN